MKPTIKDYTSITGYSAKTVREKLIKLFGEPSDRPTPADFVKAIITDLSETAAGRAKEEGDHNLDRNQMAARKDAAHAEKLEMENATRKGELVEAEEVKRAWVQITSNIRTSLMSLPSRVALEVSAMTEPRQVQILLDEEVRSTLTQLAE